MGRREERDVQKKGRNKEKGKCRKAEIYCRARTEHIKKKVKGLEKEK